MPLCVLASLILHAGLFAAGAYVVVDVAGGTGGGGENGDEPTSFTMHLRARGAESNLPAPSASSVVPEDPDEALATSSAAPPPEMPVAAPLEKSPGVAVADDAEAPPARPDEPAKFPVRDEGNAPPTAASASRARDGSSEAVDAEVGTAAHEASSLGSGGGGGSGVGAGSGFHAGEGTDRPGPAGRSSPAVLVFDPRPDYPLAAIRHGEEGAVLCAMRVGADGRVEDVEIVRSSGHQRLDRSASQALRRWIFEPAREDGRAVPSRVLHQIAFRLD